MAVASARRGRGEDSVYFDPANNCWTGAVSLGYSADGRRRLRRKVTGRTKTEVRDKLKALHRDLETGIHTSPTCTMAACIEDWLFQGLGRLSAETVANYRFAAAHAIARLGAVRLSAHDVTLEDTARLVGHSGTSVTERVYRHEIRPSLTQGAEVMDHIFP